MKDQTVIANQALNALRESVAAREDTARLDWLESPAYRGQGPNDERTLRRRMGQSWRAAIDAAIARAEGG